MHPGIKLRHVRTFLAIAAEGSLSAVARAQRLTQPALSRTLAELEVLLGKPLFHRQGRRLTLTEAGISFRRHAAEAVQLLETAAAAVHPSATPTSLRLGVLPTAARRLFPDLALRFRDACPETVLTMMTGAHEYLLRLLREGRIDLMIGRMPAAADIAGLSFTHLYDEEVVVALRAGHSMAQGDPAQLLTRLPVILPPEGAIIRRAVDDWIALQGLGKLRPAFETVSPEIGRSLVLASDAAWLISGGVIRPEVTRGEMIAKPLGAGFLSGPVGITRREDDAADASGTLILRLARELHGVDAP